MHLGIPGWHEQFGFTQISVGIPLVDEISWHEQYWCRQKLSILTAVSKDAECINDPKYLQNIQKILQILALTGGRTMWNHRPKYPTIAQANTRSHEDICQSYDYLCLWWNRWFQCAALSRNTSYRQCNVKRERAAPSGRFAENSATNGINENVGSPIGWQPHGEKVVSEEVEATVHNGEVRS